MQARLQNLSPNVYDPGQLYEFRRVIGYVFTIRLTPLPLRFGQYVVLHFFLLPSDTGSIGLLALFRNKI